MRSFWQERGASRRRISWADGGFCCAYTATLHLPSSSHPVAMRSFWNRRGPSRRRIWWAEGGDDTYWLSGLLHHSIVGEQALVQATYSQQHLNSSQAWFSLLSLVAKNEHRR